MMDFTISKCQKFVLSHIYANKMLLLFIQGSHKFAGKVPSEKQTKTSKKSKLIYFPSEMRIPSKISGTDIVPASA